LQNARHINEDSIKNVRPETRKNVSKTKGGVGETQLMTLKQRGGKNISAIYVCMCVCTHTYTDINELKEGYQHRTKLVKGENNNLSADSHSIFNRCENYGHGLTSLGRQKCVRLKF